MKVVLDTNVVVSGLLTEGGVCAGIIDQMRAGAFRLCIDGRILAEYAEVLRRAELSLPAGAVSDFLDFARHRGEPIDAPLCGVRLADESDLPFLEVALAGEAVLVTGNARHFPAKACRDVRVVSPAEFIALLRRLAGP